jgi:hypothetical protein
MTVGEIEQYLIALEKVPPVGWSFMGVPKK